ncbi:hypothetical protein BX616_007702 [Lobosporangium transversale]|nr:hypothetical protein BX616_007702 [Lobosporangium transversale]
MVHLNTDLAGLYHTSWAGATSLHGLLVSTHKPSSIGDGKIFNVAFFFSSEIQEEYKRRNNGQENLVRANDVFFAVHALIIATFTLIQTQIYKRDEDQRVSRSTFSFILVFIVATILSTIGIGLGIWPMQHMHWIDLLYFFSHIKMIVSFLKYLPQAFINYKAKSTAGWSIHNILLDLTGGVLSIAQLVLDTYLSGDWSGISGNPVKFGLGFLSIAFDLLFITQHYILYRDRTDIYATGKNDDDAAEEGYPYINHVNNSSRVKGAEERDSLLINSSSNRKYDGTRRPNDLEA